MFLFYGKRNARIKQYKTEEQSCKHCGHFNITVKVYQEYFHLFYLPIAPVGTKEAVMTCNNCGQPVRLNRLSNKYEEKTRSPFYYYTIPLLIAALIITLITSAYISNSNQTKYINAPQTNDVYVMYQQEDSMDMYYFVRIVKINEDTLFALNNQLFYSRYVYKMDPVDYFTENDTTLLFKHELPQMYEDKTIQRVFRNYDDEDGFTRIN